MEGSSTLRALRTWLDELADTEDQFAWIRDTTLEERETLAREPVESDGSHPRGHPLPDVMLVGDAGETDAEELGTRVESEPSLGGHFDNATFRPVSDAGTIGVFALRPL